MTRLIDADELKKAIKNTEYFNEYAFGFICDIIDNAPTVEPDKELKEKIVSYKNAYRIMSDAFENEVKKN